MSDRFEIIEKELITLNGVSYEEYDAVNKTHSEHRQGSWGIYDKKEKKGIIGTYCPVIKKLVSDGYKDIGYCNGGDDDILVVDHQRKEYTFFEDYVPIDLQEFETLQAAHDGEDSFFHNDEEPPVSRM